MGNEVTGGSNEVSDLEKYIWTLVAMINAFKRYATSKCKSISRIEEYRYCTSFYEYRNSRSIGISFLLNVV